MIIKRVRVTINQLISSSKMADILKVGISYDKKPSVAAEQADLVKVACSQEEICDAVTHGQSTETDKENVKWLALTFLVIILIAIIAVRFSNTPAATRADGIPAGWQQRDLSTPSSRLVGHWENVNGGADIYYDFIDPQLKIGSCIISNRNGNLPVQFKVLSEEPSGKNLKIREFFSLDKGQVSFDLQCCIPKDGQSMTKEYTYSDGSNSLFIYRYVDGRVDPSSTFIPFHHK